MKVHKIELRTDKDDYSLDFTYQGKTQKESVAQMKRDVANKLIGTFQPYARKCRSWGLLVWRDQWGWSWKVYQPSFDVIDAISCHNSRGNSGDAGADRSQAISEGLLNLAQFAWEQADGNKVPDWMPDSVCDDFRTWIIFQQRYKAAQNSGLNQTECHAYAGQDPTRPELWQEIQHPLA